jgi:FOG: TPR repeat
MAPMKGDRGTIVGRLVWGMGAYAFVLASVWLAGCGREATTGGRMRVEAAVTQTSVSCRSCHEEIFAAWATTDHGRANRTVDPTVDAEAMAAFAAAGGDTAGAAMVLGHKPLWQPLIATEGNRWQPHELAFDPERKEWFNVFGDEERRPGEWGHWTGRGMNWNSMCAHCHMTGYQKNYDEKTDAYASTWVEHGVGCIQCHGPMPEGHGTPGAKRSEGASLLRGDRGRMMQTCAPCHAHNEQLTLEFQPGDAYHDHYRVTLPVEEHQYYADGQQRDEVFTWTSVLLSRMGHAGVTCMDCHDPHSTKTILPVSNNALCLQCHAAPGRTQPNGTLAPVIDPPAHSRHAEGSAGNLCVSCHMPTTNYMQRAPRHDHGWLKPDPLLTKELGIPNACNRCHTDKPVEWAIEHAEAWYGEKLESRQRERARAVAAGRASEAGAAERLRELLKTEDIAAWRATYLTLLARLPDEDGASVEVARNALNAADPLERAAAAGFLGAAPGEAERLRGALKDASRLVRLEAAWALSPQLEDGSAERKELDAYLAVNLDQPAGRARRAADLANRGRLIEAESELKRAVAWDPYSAAIRQTLARVLAAQDRLAEAAAEHGKAAELEPENAPAAFQAGLAWAEAGRLREAEAALRSAVAIDPGFARAWYNLGLLLAQTNRVAAAEEMLRKAEEAAPRDADVAYARATVLWRMQRVDEARAAAERALRIDPAHAEAAQFLRTTAR